MTVCITGDVHHMSMGTRDQEYLECTEVKAAIEYAEIAAEYDVPVTLFCTGKCISEEPDRMARLAAMDNVELGGHNYWAFTTPVHKGWRALGKATGSQIGSWMGPRWFQSYEVRKTISAFTELGVDIQCWRDHAYRHDRYTTGLLSKYGITHFSDAVEPKGELRQEAGLVNVPINTPPDHEYVYHAFRRTHVAPETDFEGSFGSELQKASAWCGGILDAVKDRDEQSQHVTVLAHPACMQLADELDAFERLCAQIDTVRQLVPMSRVRPDE